MQMIPRYSIGPAKGYLRAAESYILSLSSDPDLQQRTGLALLYSISMEWTSDSSIKQKLVILPSAQEICGVLSLDPNILYDNGVLIGKNEAQSFLGDEQIGQKTFRKRDFTATSYHKKFGRKISKRDGKAYIFTYAEILSYVEMDRAIPFPTKLKGALPPSKDRIILPRNG